MEDCIIVSDDEDVQLIKQVVNLVPPVIDLSDSEESIHENGSQQQHQKQPLQQHRPPLQQHQPPQQQHQQPQQQQHQPHQPQPAPKQQHQQPQPEPKQQQQQPKQQYQPPQQQRQQQQQPQAAPEQQHQHQQPQPQPQSEPEPEPRQQHQQPQPEPRQRHQHSQQPQPAPKQVAPPPQRVLSDYELMIAQKELGNEKYKKFQFDDAVRIYRRANELAKKLKNDEMSAILHFNLAMTYYKLGSFDQAADECANAVKIDDNYIKAHLKRAEIYQRQRKFEEAVICYEHVCEIDSKSPDYAILLSHAKDAAKITRKKDFCLILGLNPFNFTREELKKAYRQKALSHHPDRHSDADIVTRRIEEKLFKEASEAHCSLQAKLNNHRRF